MLTCDDLDYYNYLLHDIVSKRLDQPSEASSIDQLLSDFDGVVFHVSTPESKSKLLISMNIRCYDALITYGADTLLQKIYGDMITSPESGYDFSIILDLAQCPADPDEKAALANKISLMKRNALAAPFEMAFTIQEKLASEYDPDKGTMEKAQIMTIHYREEETIYLIPEHDRVTVIFTTEFKDETDRVFGKVFLQEFVDARKRPSIQHAPQVLYSYREPPLEIRDLPGLKQRDNIGYVTFVLFPRHFATPDKREECISRIQVFRDALHYHIKKSKAFMHTRMRSRVTEFLKVLNRAKPSVPGEKEKKTISGRSFSANRRQ